MTLVGDNQFHDYHLAWWHGMWPSFGPVALMLACSVALLAIKPRGIPRLALWAGVLLQVTVHTLTALFWAPIQASLATTNGISHEKYHGLMSTHWLRVSFFFAYAVLMLVLFQAFTRANELAARQRKV